MSRPLAIRLLSSTNTSGTNTYSGSIYLDSPLTVSATAAGGTFAISGSQFDVKSQALTITGPGVVNVTTGIFSSTNAGTVTYSGAGTLLLNGANTYNGTTTINSGTLGGTGSVSGAVNVNTATINPGQIGAAGSAAAVGTLTTGALTLVGSSTSVFDLASTASYDQLNANGAVTLAGTLTINLGSTIAAGTVLDLVHGTSLAGTYTGIANNGTYTFGGEQFTAMYTGTDFELVAVPEPATYLGGLLLFRRGRLPPAPPFQDCRAGGAPALNRNATLPRPASRRRKHGLRRRHVFAQQRHRIARPAQIRRRKNDPFPFHASAPAFEVPFQRLIVFLAVRLFVETEQQQPVLREHPGHVVQEEIPFPHAPSTTPSAES